MLLSVSSVAQTDLNFKHPKVAVVLSRRAAKGFAHIGALKVLEEEGIPIDIIVSTSMGSLIGGFYSLGVCIG
jgi:NTE family protein